MSIAEGRHDSAASLADPVVLRCATCDLPITAEPEREDGQEFCCAGCVVGGPCICPRDASSEQGWDSRGLARRSSGWPIDGRVMLDLLSQIGRLAHAAREGDDPDLHRQLDVLRRHASAGWVTFDPEVAAVGRRVTIQDQDQHRESFWLALPGREHATADTVSIAGETGGALAGARVGDVVYVESDGRRRWAVVMRVA